MVIDSGVAYHAKLAEGWDRRYARGGFRRRALFFRAAIVPKLGLAGEWLDLGCGSGYFTRMLCEAGARIAGVDGAPEMIKAARALSADPQTAPISFATMEIGDRLDITDASFDGLLCLSVLEYLDCPEGCLAEIHRVLKPGGQIVLSVPNRNSVLRHLQQARRGFSAKRDGGEAYLTFSRWSTSTSELRTLALRQGFTDIDIVPFDPVLPRMTLGFVPASLLYLVARRPRANAASATVARPEAPAAV